MHLKNYLLECFEISNLIKGHIQVFKIVYAELLIYYLKQQYVNFHQSLLFFSMEVTRKLALSDLHFRLGAINQYLSPQMIIFLLPRI